MPQRLDSLPSTGGNCRFERLALNESLVLYVLGDEAVLYSALSRSLFGLDAAALAVLSRLANGETADSLMAGLPEVDAAAVAELAAILHGQEPETPEYRAEIFCPESVCQDEHISQCYRLLSTVFTITCSDKSVLDLISSSFNHLILVDHPPVNLKITLEQTASQWCLLFNGMLQGEATPLSMVLPKLYDRLRKMAYQCIPFMLAIHAAALSDDRNSIIFAGQSGSGKSTIAATLMAHGFRLFSDEVALITERGMIMPIPLGIGLKSGSWSLLQNDFPALMDLPEHIRWDNSHVRYLVPDDSDSIKNTEVNTVTQICFPCFDPLGQNSLKVISPVSTLRLLTESGYQLRDLQAEHVDNILKWLTGLTCFTLAYSSTEGALKLLGTVLNNSRIPDCRHDN